MTRSDSEWRSLCPLNIALEILGDRWTFLILRDLILKRHSTFKEIQESGEGIATNILSDRLKLLLDEKIISGTRSETDARVIRYRPTEKGLDLLPVMIELILWADRHEKTAATRPIIERLQNDRDGFIAEVRHRFVQR